MDTDPARKNMVEKVGFEQENKEKSSSVLKFSVQWKELNKHLDERALEIEDTKKWGTEQLKEIDREREIETKLPLESSLTKDKEEEMKELETKETEIVLKQKEEAMEMDLLARNVELEKKEELFGKVEERERKVALRESTIAEEKEKESESEVKKKLAMELRLGEVEEREKKVGLLEDSIKEKERDMEVKESAMRLAVEKEKEEAMKKVEDKEKEVELLFKLTNEKSCQLESKVEQFEVKQIVATERNKKDAAAIETKIKLLELKEKEVEEKVKELKFLMQKNMELGEGSIQAEAESSKKRSRAEDTLIGCSAKRHNHDDKDKETESSLEEIIAEPTNGGDVSTEQPVARTCVVESEFNSFKKTINSFKVNQLWALYNHGIDGMPRLYGRIKAIVKSQSCIIVKWLNPKESDHVPVACGRYQYGERGSQDLLAFSHEMQGSIVRGNNFTAVYPKKGEIWALFRNWNKSWNNNNTQLHKPPYNYDFVEILLEFDARLGVAGVYLEKVDGFVSVFKHSEQQQQQRLATLIVPADEMNRFSHKVPSSILSGEEKQGVPVGSFELDPATVPSIILDNKEPKKEGTERQSEEEGVEAAAGQNGITIDVPIILD